MTTGLRTLVLDANYTPVSLFPIENIPAEDAVTRLVNGTCHVVFEYDRPILTPTLEMNWPSVIARNSGDLANAQGVKLEVESLYYRDHGICAYCERPLSIKRHREDSLTYDHVIPTAKGGWHGWDNIVASCGKCNHAKSDALPKGQWMPKTKPYIPTYWDLVSKRRKFPIIIPSEDWMHFLGDWDAEVTIAGA